MREGAPRKKAREDNRKSERKNERSKEERSKEVATSIEQWKTYIDTQLHEDMMSSKRKDLTCLADACAICQLACRVSCAPTPTLCSENT